MPAAPFSDFAREMDQRAQECRVTAAILAADLPWLGFCLTQRILSLGKCTAGKNFQPQSQHIKNQEPQSLQIAQIRLLLPLFLS